MSGSQALMASHVEIDCGGDLLRSLGHLLAIFREKTLPILILFALVLFVVLVPELRLLAAPFLLGIYLTVACWLVRAVFAAVEEDGVVADGVLTFGGPPLLSLLFLEIVYRSTAVVLLLLPGLWWSVATSLAIVHVCLKEAGAIEALKVSLCKTKLHFWRSFGYLVPAAFLAYFPALVAYSAVSILAFLLETVTPETALLFEFALLAASFLCESLLLVGGLMLLTCQVRLYLYLNEPAPQVGTP